MNKNLSASDHLERASKLDWIPSHAIGMLRAARELAIENNNQLRAFAYLSEAYADRLNRVIEAHIEHLRYCDFSEAAQRRADAMGAADEALDDAQKALRLTVA